MSTPDVCQINTSKLSEESNLPVIQATVPITGPDDYENFGEVASYQTLGVTTLPFPPNDDGHAEGIIMRDVGGFNGAVVGARDERCAGVVASMKAGDTVLHATDPNAKAQVRCHADRRVAAVTEDSEKKTMMLLLDGKEDKIQISAFGGIIELTKDSLSLIAPGSQASITMSGDQITILGKVQIGGIAPTHTVLAIDPAGYAALKAALVNLNANIYVASGVTTTGI